MGTRCDPTETHCPSKETVCRPSPFSLHFPWGVIPSRPSRDPRLLREEIGRRSRPVLPRGLLPHPPPCSTCLTPPNPGSWGPAEGEGAGAGNVSIGVRLYQPVRSRHRWTHVPVQQCPDLPFPGPIAIARPFPSASLRSGINHGIIRIFIVGKTNHFISKAWVPPTGKVSFYEFIWFEDVWLTDVPRPPASCIPLILILM